MVKAIDAFNYWSTECLHVWLFLGTPETSKEHVLSGTPQSWRKFIDDQENGPKILFVG